VLSRGQSLKKLYHYRCGGGEDINRRWKYDNGIKMSVRGATTFQKDKDKGEGMGNERGDPASLRDSVQPKWGRGHHYTSRPLLN